MMPWAGDVILRIPPENLALTVLMMKAVEQLNYRVCYTFSAVFVALRVKDMFP